MSHAAGLVDELTDWHNLLQGGLGSLIGSMLGVLGAFFAALWTIRRQRRNDRDLARDLAGVEAVRNVEKKLRAVAARLGSIKFAREWSTDMPFDRVEAQLRGPAEEFGDAVQGAGPSYPSGWPTG